MFVLGFSDRDTRCVTCLFLQVFVPLIKSEVRFGFCFEVGLVVGGAFTQLCVLHNKYKDTPSNKLTTLGSLIAKQIIKFLENHGHKNIILEGLRPAQIEFVAETN
jgi:hypothetical protein